MKETDTSTTTCTPLTTHKIRPKMPMEVSGLLISSRSDSDQEESTTFTTSWPVIISRPHTDLMFLKENTLILTSTTWSSVCQDNSTMECSTSKTELQPPPLKWPTMSLTSSSSWTEEVVGQTLIRKSENGCGSQPWSSWFHWDTWTLTASTEISFLPELKCMLSETLWDTSIGNQDSKASRPSTTETLTGHDSFYFIKIVLIWLSFSA